MGGKNINAYEDVGGVNFPVEELLMLCYFTTVGPGAIAFLGALEGITIYNNNRPSYAV